MADFKMAAMKKQIRPHLGFYAKQRIDLNVNLHVYKLEKCIKSMI